MSYKNPFRRELNNYNSSEMGSSPISSSSADKPATDKGSGEEKGNRLFGILTKVPPKILFCGSLFLCAVVFMIINDQSLFPKQNLTTSPFPPVSEDQMMSPKEFRNSKGIFAQIFCRGAERSAIFCD